MLYCRDRQSGKDKRERIGFCLLDVYFGLEKLEEVVGMLGRVVPEDMYY